MTENVIDITHRNKKKFSDFANEPEMLDGDKTPIERVLNTEIEIIGYRITNSKYPKNNSGKCLTIQYVGENGSRHIIFTGSDVLINQLEKYGDQIPFFATIRRVNKYYTLS